MYNNVKGLIEDGKIFKVIGSVERTERVSSEGEEYTHTQVICKKIKEVHVGSDKEWEVNYPLLKGKLRILPGQVQKSKSLANSITSGLARTKINEERIGSL